MTVGMEVAGGGRRAAQGFEPLWASYWATVDL
jgi:hypothetical protein